MRRNWRALEAKEWTAGEQGSTSHCTACSLPGHVCERLGQWSQCWKDGSCVALWHARWMTSTELEAAGLPLVDTLLPTHDGCLQAINQNGTEKSWGRIIYKIVLGNRTKGCVKLSISKQMYQGSVSYLASLFSHHEVND